MSTLEGMPADKLHLIRHGEVFNPEHVLYGRLPGFGLSKLGHIMAQMAADELTRELGESGKRVSALVVSPLQRTQESATPIAVAFGVEPQLDDRVIEAGNAFQGRRMRGSGSVMRDPKSWSKMMNPWRPSWGEPFADIAARMLAVIRETAERVDGGDVVIVSHQLPIWMVHRRAVRKGLAHDPRLRRCALSSITSFEYGDRGLHEIGYADPAAHLTASDLGAV